VKHKGRVPWSILKKQDYNFECTPKNPPKIKANWQSFRNWAEKSLNMAVNFYEKSNFLIHQKLLIPKILKTKKMSKKRFLIRSTRLTTVFLNFWAFHEYFHQISLKISVIFSKIWIFPHFFLCLFTNNLFLFEIFEILKLTSFKLFNTI